MISFNAFVSKTQEIGGNTPVWLGVVKPLPVGAVLASGFVAKDAYFGAGCPVKYDASNKTVAPFINWVVKSVATSTHTLTVYDNGYAPAVGDILMGVGASFEATGAAAKVSAVAASSTSGCIDITFTDAKLDTLAENAVIAYSSATAVAASGASLKYIPNGYLYNDIYLGDEELDSNAAASAAIVVAHNEGLLINRTMGYAVADLLAAAIPNVIQVNG